MADLLSHKDAYFLICPKCKILSFDPKTCVNCDAAIPPYTRIKVLNKNNEFYEITGNPLGNTNRTVFSRTVPKVRKLSVPDRPHDGNCACLKYLKTEEEVRKSYSAAKEDEIMKELAEEEIEHPSEEREQTTDGHEHATKDHEHTTEEENSPALATSSYSVHPAVRIFPISDTDIACLDVGNMLKDSIIDFYLNYIYYEMIPAEFQVRTHIFSSYFYTSLCRVCDKKCTLPWLDVQERLNRWTKNINICSKDFIFVPVNWRKHWLDVQERLNRWTKNVDIFSKDFIFVPVNWRKHWYLAVICFLTQLHKNSHEAISTESNPTAVENKESSDERHSEYDSQSTRKKNSTFLDKGKPCICFFDSFDNSTVVGKDKKSVAENLKVCLKMLWIKKYPGKSYDWDSLPYFKAVCPQQENDVDCGLYLLQYVESFFQNPIPNFENSMPVLKNWFSNSIMTFKRAQITKVISDLKGKELKAVSPASSFGSDVICIEG